MERKRVNTVTVSIVVLDQSLRSDIPDLDSSIGTSRSNASAVRMEPYRVDFALVVGVLMNQVFLGNVPKFN